MPEEGYVICKSFEQCSIWPAHCGGKQFADSEVNVVNFFERVFFGKAFYNMDTSIVQLLFYSHFCVEIIKQGQNCKF